MHGTTIVLWWSLPGVSSTDISLSRKGIAFQQDICTLRKWIWHISVASSIWSQTGLSCIGPESTMLLVKHPICWWFKFSVLLIWCWVFFARKVFCWQVDTHHWHRVQAWRDKGSEWVLTMFLLANASCPSGGLEFFSLLLHTHTYTHTFFVFLWGPLSWSQ